jgi:hypothetical protein
MTLMRSGSLREDPPVAGPVAALPAEDGSSASAADDPGRITPMMEQYIEI